MKHAQPTTTNVPGPVGRLVTTVEGTGGLPVLFIHDNAGDRSHWAAAQHHLDTRSVSMDLRGLGDSEGSKGPFGVEAAVEDLAAVADALLPQPFVLVGHGFGATVAGAYASYYPERLAGLLLVEPPADLRQMPAKEKETLLREFTQERYGAFHEHWLTHDLEGAKDATRTLVMKTLRTSRRAPVAGNLESSLSHDPGEVLSAFKGPIHALVSSVGPHSLVGQHPELTRALAPHTSHWVMLDAPDWFHTELMKFVGHCKHPGTPA